MSNVYQGGKECNGKFTVKVQTRLRVRTGPSTVYPVKDYLYNNDTIEVTRIDNDNWYYIPSVDGWCCKIDGQWQTLDGSISINNTEVINVTVDELISENTENNTSSNNSELLDYIDINDITDYLPNVSDYLNSDENLASKLVSDEIHGIYGMPYQFMETVDIPLMNGNGSKLPFGQIYAEKIVSRMPLLFITPGRPDFMRTFSKEQRKGVISSLIDATLGGVRESDIDSIINNYGRYYTFKFDYSTYFKYVNTACQVVADLLGIGNERITMGSVTDCKLKKVDWSKVLNNNFKSYFTAKESIPFYMDSMNTINDNFSNNTTESMLSSKMNSFSDLGREAGFLLGAGFGAKLSVFSTEDYNQTLSQINKVIDDMLGGNNIIKRISTGFSTVATGGKLVFPEIWSDSDFSRSYDINIKLRSPDHDSLSLFLNVIVPYIHIICFTAAQQLGPNGYQSPFLVRAFSKGLMNVDMGIITSLSASKGKEGAWNADGIPTEMDVSITIKDLYNQMYISQAADFANVGQLMNNTAYLDYLCNMAGVNLNKPEITRLLELYVLLYSNSITSTPSKIWTSFENSISNLSKNLLGRY